jgi:serine/threonine protein kinase/sugar lactone lactonase YvrE
VQDHGGVTISALMTPGGGSPARLVSGNSIGPYQLLERLGAGGMGEVWSALDTRLDRKVALKFASSHFSDRFAREARSIAALNHPGICTLYDVGPDYLVMELIGGRTLDQTIPKHGLRVGEALRYSVEIADALAAAHAHGIVHRDLKPSNVMITLKGRVKVLDFGLAKLAVSGSLASSAGHDTATALASPSTGQGAIVGTVAYMSPEQAQGLPIDARSDIFSFGVLLYEMLTGAKAFTGDTTVATLAAVVNQEPRAARELADLPPELDRLVGRCLRKDPSRRIQTMADLHAALVDLKEESDSGKLSAASARVATPAGSSPRTRWLWPSIAAAAVMAAGAAWWFTPDRTPPVPSSATIVRLTNDAGRQLDPALSPDGNQLAYSWDGGKGGGDFDIYVKLIGQSESLRLTTDPGPDRYPVWSPDGKRIAFRRGDAVYTMSALGGSERKIGSGFPTRAATIGAGQMSWSPDGKWLAIPAETGVFALPSEGGAARAATVSPAALERQDAPAFSPDGRTLAFFGCGASTVSCRIFLQPLGAGGAPDGPPRRLFDKPFRVGGGMAWSRDGQRVIFFGSPHQGGNGFLWQVPADGTEPPARLEPNVPATMSGVSIAGDRLAFTLGLGGSQVWQVTDGGSREPLIRSAVWDLNASFSPDGRRVVWASNRAGDGDHIFAANADGSEVAQLTGAEVIFAANPSWSTDGKWVVFQNQREDGNFDIVVMDAAGGPLRRLTTGHTNTVPIVSRDGTRVWFVSNRTGRHEIWRVPFSGGEEVQVSFEGRRAPQESPDGRTLYCLDSEGTLYARDIASGSETRVLPGVVAYAPMSDGFYVVRTPEAAGAATPVLQFTDLSGGRARVIAAVPGHYALDKAMVSVSPDRRRILYSATPAAAMSVIEMLEGFR